MCALRWKPLPIAAKWRVMTPTTTRTPVPKCYQDRQVRIYGRADTVGESALLGFIPKSDCSTALFTPRQDGRIKARPRLCRHAGGEQAAATGRGTGHPNRTQNQYSSNADDPALLRGGLGLGRSLPAS